MRFLGHQSLTDSYMRTLKRGSYQAQYSRALSAVTVRGRWVAVIDQPGGQAAFGYLTTMLGL